jgi:hypothetical protein
MTPISTHHIDQADQLGREIDDLLLQLRGLVLVRDLLEARNATEEEVDAHAREADRIRRMLIDRLRHGLGPEVVEAA